MMKRIMHKVKLVLVGAVIAALDRVILELEEYLEREYNEAQEAPLGEQGGNGYVCSNGVQ